MSTYYYSILKCTTDSKRQETVNIGVVVFKDKEIDVRLLENTTKRVMFLNDSLEESLSDIADRYAFFTSFEETAEEKHKIIKSFGGAINLGGLGFFSASKAREYNKKVSQLMMTLVEPPKISRTVQKQHFSSTIRDYFASINLLGEKQSDILKHKVVPNFTLDTALDIKAEFMLKNGVYHLTETLDFNAHKHLSDKRKQTAYKLFTFERADKVLDNKVERYFVYSASGSNETKSQALLDLVEDHNASMFNWDSDDDQKKYKDLISQYAGLQKPVDNSTPPPQVH